MPGVNDLLMGGEESLQFVVQGEACRLGHVPPMKGEIESSCASSFHQKSTPSLR